MKSLNGLSDHEELYRACLPLRACLLLESCIVTKRVHCSFFEHVHIVLLKMLPCLVLIRQYKKLFKAVVIGKQRRALLICTDMDSFAESVTYWIAAYD
jgi:hypothetical protein